MLLKLLIACSLLSTVSCAHQLLLVSSDGFRYDYLDWYPNETEFLRSLIPQGVHVKRMTPAFATKTFPNHWTIVTGLFQESHGIVSNKMYDPEFNSTFHKRTTDERWWNASLPIWINAEKQNLRAATFFWPGSDVAFEGRRQTHYFLYNESIPFEYRVDTVLKWITDEKMNLSVMYLEEPDVSGHNYGPNSTEVREAVGKVDKTIRRLFDGLKERNLTDKVNVVIVSDHGMTEFSQQRIVRFNQSMNKYIDVNGYVDEGALFGVNPKPGMRDQLVKHIQEEIEANNFQVRVFAKENLPARYRYSTHRRIPGVLVLPDLGYYVVGFNSTKVPKRKGGHGFDNQYNDMLVPMFGLGPSFRKNVVVNSFRQIDIYGLLCHLLEIKPQPNNGSLELLPVMLNAASNNNIDSRILGLTQLFVISVAWSMSWLHCTV